MSLAIKIAITPKASGQPSYEILDLIVVSGRAYLSLKDENTSAITDTTAWMQITENTYDIAVRLGYVGTEAQWLASLSAASEAAAVIALDAAGDANDAATAANAAAGLAQDAATSANTAATNITSTVPWSLYRSRVLADSGVISDLEKLTKLYVENLKLLDNTVFLWDGSAGMKTRTSGANTYATNLYDMSAGNRDAIQATEANQPFVGGGIAPSEKKRLKNLSTVSTKGLTHTQISFSATDNWSVTTVLKGFEKDPSQSVGMYAGKSGTVDGLYLYRSYNRIALYVGTTEFATGNISSNLDSNIGKSMIVTWIYTANALLLFVNGVQIPIITTFSQFAFAFDSVFFNLIGQRNLAGEIYHHQIFNKALSLSEVQAQHAYLRLQHPEIEGVAIGNQFWATSNYEGVVTGNGTVIPEVQDNVAWAALTTPAWCHYNNDPLNGAVYGKLYNWYAVQAIADNPPQGWRVPTLADYVQLSNHLGGNSVAGGKMKKEGLYPYYNTENVGATNESGFSGIGCGYRMADSSFAAIRYGMYLHTNSEYTATLTRDAVALGIAFISEANKKLGHSLRLIRNEPVGANERTIETGYITNALGVTNLDISIPFGYQVESIRFDSETDITGLSAKLLTGALVELETLFTAKSVIANIQKVIAADADQSIQQTDAVVRINGTKSNTSARFRVWIKLTKVVFS